MESPKTSVAPALGDMSKEDFRRLGHDLIDWIADYFDNIDELPVLAAIAPSRVLHTVGSLSTADLAAIDERSRRALDLENG